MKALLSTVCLAVPLLPGLWISYAHLSKWEGSLPRSVAIGARVEVFREFTNSDTTTERGEWLLSNLLLTPQYSHGFYKRDGYETTLAFRAPALAVPTSKASRSNGTILGLGARLIGLQDFPLLG